MDECVDEGHVIGWSASEIFSNKESSNEHHQMMLAMKKCQLIVFLSENYKNLNLICEYLKLNKLAVSNKSKSFIKKNEQMWAVIS